MMMSPTVLPAPNIPDTDSAVALLAVLADPAKYKKLLDDLASKRNALMEEYKTAKAAQDKQFESVQTDLNAREDLIAERESTLLTAKQEIEALQAKLVAKDGLLQDREIKLRDREIAAETTMKKAEELHTQSEALISKLKGVIGSGP